MKMFKYAFDGGTALLATVIMALLMVVLILLGAIITAIGSYGWYVLPVLAVLSGLWLIAYRAAEYIENE